MRCISIRWGEAGEVLINKAYRGVQLIWGNLTPKNTLYSDNHGLFHIVIQAKKYLSLNFIDRTREWYTVYKLTDIFKTWTVSGDATSIFWASLTISGSGRPSAKRDRHIFFKFRTRSRNNYLPLVREFWELRTGQFFVTLDNARPRLLWRRVSVLVRTLVY